MHFKHVACIIIKREKEQDVKQGFALFFRPMSGTATQTAPEKPNAKESDIIFYLAERKRGKLSS